MEIALRDLDGVDKISISISKQRFQVTYKSGASFQPWDIREAVAKAEVAVVRFLIVARAMFMKKEGSGSLWRAKEKFFLGPLPKFPLKARSPSGGASDLRPSPS